MDGQSQLGPKSELKLLHMSKHTECAASRQNFLLSVISDLDSLHFVSGTLQLACMAQNNVQSGHGRRARGRVN